MVYYRPFLLHLLVLGYLRFEVWLDRWTLLSSSSTSRSFDRRPTAAAAALVADIDTAAVVASYPPYQTLLTLLTLPAAAVAAWRAHPMNRDRTVDFQKHPKMETFAH